MVEKSIRSFHYGSPKESAKMHPVSASVFFTMLPIRLAQGSWLVPRDESVNDRASFMVRA